MAQWRDRCRVMRVLQGSGSKWSSVHTCHRCPERRSPAWVKPTSHARASKHCEYILRLQKSCCYYHTSAMCCQRKSAWFTFYRVKDLDAQIGPERQRMVYQNFIKPFLARNSTTDGTVFCALIFSYSLRQMFWLWVFFFFWLWVFVLKLAVWEVQTAPWNGLCRTSRTSLLSQV